MSERSRHRPVCRHRGQAEVRQTGKGGAGAGTRGGETANRKGVDWQVRPATCDLCVCRAGILPLRHRSHRNAARLAVLRSFLLVPARLLAVLVIASWPMAIRIKMDLILSVNHFLARSQIFRLASKISQENLCFHTTSIKIGLLINGLCWRYRQQNKRMFT